MKTNNDRIISLAPLTVLPCSPVQQIDVAAASGFNAVSLRLLPVMESDIDVMADKALQAAIEQHLSTTGLRVLDVEVARATSALDVPALIPTLEFAGSIGAQRFAITAEAEGYYDAATEAGVVRRIAELCEAGERFGVGVMLEFMAYRSIRSLEHAANIVATVGHPGLGITIDALHLFRSGGTAKDILGIPRQALACVQLCDAPAAAPSDLAGEARSGRLYPGDGDLPLGELLRALPSDLPISIEVPATENASMTVLERATRAAASLQPLVSA
ncbi:MULTISPECIES: TIM barrel protein [unclassified Arthrobacter]|uniref:sugar phosphate isomerase/epimerase family protein n=1 Tax=unclassified Arthrobacter TaxID=235627 RepID=UPI002882ED6B|nr:MULTISPECIES: TIM barrel protein [unclassified Arthrobacter]